MASEVEICNLALNNLRAGSINNLNEHSLQAQTCKLRYPLVRDMLLQNQSWSFSRKILGLAPIVAPVFMWPETYQYPTDCLHINRLIPEYESAENNNSRTELRQKIEYEIFNTEVGRVIGTDEQRLRIDYRAKVTDPNLFTPMFINALAYLLASEMAVGIVGAERGERLQQSCYAAYQQQISAASSLDRNESFIAQPESEFITVQG